MTGAALQTIGLNIAAGAVQEFNISGTYLSCLSSSQVSFRVQLDDDSPSDFFQGLTVYADPGRTFARVIIDNTANASALTGELAFGTGRLVDARRIDTTPLLASLVTVADVACAPGAATLVAAADNNRQSVSISNLGLNPREVRVGDVNVGAARGSELPAGETITIDTAGAVYVWNPHTAAMSVGVLIVEA